MRSSLVDDPRSAARIENRVVYLFDRFRLDPTEHLLLRDGQPIPLTGKAFQTLLFLVRRSGHLVEKSELIAAVWEETFVEEANLAVTISMLRKKLGDKRNEHKYIETVAKQGYRFVAEVRKLDERRESESESESMTPPELAAGPAAGIPQKRRSLSIALRIAGAGLIAASIVALAPIHLSSAAPREIHALAVLPFAASGINSVDSSGAQLGLSIADDLASRLGSAGSIEVRPTSALAGYGKQATDLLAVGRQQKVDAVLTGKMVNSAGRVHVTAQLIQVLDGAVLWTGTFEEPIGQVLPLEDQMEESVSEFLFPHRTQLARATRETRDPEAYQLYLEGRYFWNKRTEDGLRRSIEYFQRAVLKDPGYAKAYAGLADSYTLLASYGVEGPREAYPNAEAAALKAVQLDQSLAEAHTSLGYASFYYVWDWSSAETEFQRAIKLNPNYPMVHTWYAVELAATGQQRKALEQAQRGVELDPLSLIANTELGRVYYWNGQYDKAIAAYKHAIDLDPYFSRAHNRLGIAYLAEHDYRDAMSEFKKVDRLSGPDPYLDGLIGYAEAGSGNRAGAQKILATLTTRSRRAYVPAFSMALVCIGLGEHDQALGWLAKSYQDRSAYMVFSNVDPLLNPVRSDPRFVSLMGRMAFTQKQDLSALRIPDSRSPASPLAF